MAAGKYSNWFQWSEYETKTSLKQKKNMIAKGGKKSQEDKCNAQCRCCWASKHRLHIKELIQLSFWYRSNALETKLVRDYGYHFGGVTVVAPTFFEKKKRPRRAYKILHHFQGIWLIPNSESLFIFRSSFPLCTCQMHCILVYHPSRLLVAPTKTGRFNEGSSLHCITINSVKRKATLALSRS